MTLSRCVMLGAFLAALAAPAGAQTRILPVLDHIHLNVPDQAKGVEWYQTYFGGRPMTEAPDRLMFGETRLIFLKNDKGQPSSGSALDHLGFSFADLDAKLKEFEAAGVHAYRGGQGWREAWAPSRARARAGSGGDPRVLQREVRRRYGEAQGSPRR